MEELVGRVKFDLVSSRGRITQFTDSHIAHIYNTANLMTYYGLLIMPYPAVCLTVTERVFSAAEPYPLFIRTWVVI